MIYFSEIFPKKYQNEFLDELDYSLNVKPITSNLKKNTAERTITETARLNFFWSDTYLILAEENFDRIFKEIYEQEFIDKLFEECESMIDKEVFVNSIAGNFIE